MCLHKLEAVKRKQPWRQFGLALSKKIGHPRDYSVVQLFFYYVAEVVCAQEEHFHWLPLSALRPLSRKLSWNKNNSEKAGALGSQKKSTVKLLFEITNAPGNRSLLWPANITCHLKLCSVNSNKSKVFLKRCSMPLAFRDHVTLFFAGMKVVIFCLQQMIRGQFATHDNNVSLWKCAVWKYWYFVSGHVIKITFFLLMFEQHLFTTKRLKCALVLLTKKNKHNWQTFTTATVSWSFGRIVGRQSYPFQRGARGLWKRKNYWRFFIIQKNWLKTDRSTL